MGQAVAQERGDGGSDQDGSPEGGPGGSKFFPSHLCLFKNVYILLKYFINIESKCILKVPTH